MVKVIESSMVVPSEETPKHQISISNFDLLASGDHTPIVYVYTPTGDPNLFFSPATLKASLAKALVPFYPLAGRLRISQGGAVEIDCTGEGVTFVVAESESRVDEFGDFAPSMEMRKLLVPSVEYGNQPCVLVMIQVTFFKCGGVCLGTAVHHIATDGLGSLHFIKSWASIARGGGDGDISSPPSLDRTLLSARSPPRVLFDHAEYSQKPQMKAATGKASSDSAILKLSKKQLNSLKSNNYNGAGKGLSTFKVVAAYAWRCACRARNLEGDQETRLHMVADARSRLHPPLPPGYLGNAVFRVSAVAKAREVLSDSLEHVAQKIESATSRLDDEYIRSLIDLLELKKKDLRGLAIGEWTVPSTDLFLVSWQGLPIYDADFGWGRPLFMRRACMLLSGSVYIMHNPGDDGGVSLAVALDPETMPHFKKIFYQDFDF